MKLVISPLAARRLREIQAYIALASSLHAALRVVLRIRQSTEVLVDFPELGSQWNDGPTRALEVSGLPYRIHYRQRGDHIEIITIAHTSQRPPQFGPSLPDR